jgi:hypothetical protein
MVNALIQMDPKSAEAQVWRGRILGALAQENSGATMTYGQSAMEEFEKALTLDAGSPDANAGKSWSG